MRDFEDKLFFGTGESVAFWVRKLHEKLEKAIILANTFDSSEQELENIVRDLAMALTGREIEFKR